MLVIETADDLVQRSTNERWEIIDFMGKGKSPKPPPKTKEIEPDPVTQKPATSHWDWLPRIAAMLAIPASLIGILTAFWWASDHIVTSAIQKALDREGGVISRLTIIESHFNYLRRDVDALRKDVDAVRKDVDEMRGERARGKAHNAARLSPAALVAQIPDLNLIYREASTKRIAIPPEDNEAIRLKLGSVAADGTTGFWELAAAVVSRASFSSVGNLPIGERIGINVHDSAFTGAHIVLDGMVFKDNHCERCVVEYHGGPTDIKGSVFKNCQFILKLKEAPPPDGRKLTRTLLASNLREIKMP